MKVLSAGRWIVVMVLLLAVLILALLVGIQFGSAAQGSPQPEDAGGGLSFWQERVLIVRTLLGLDENPKYVDIVRRIRLPHVLLAALVGAGLAIAGGTFQAMLRNPLADPYILGVSGGATIGAVVAMTFKLPPPASLATRPVCAFAGALGTMMLVYWVARTRGRLQPYVLLMVGVIVNAVLGAAIMLIMTRADLLELNEIAYWLMGRVPEMPEGMDILVALAFVAVGGGLLTSRARAFNLLSLGEESSQQLGVDVERTKLVGFVGASLVTGAVVSLTGPIGFVGLIVPHLVRLIWGPDHRLLLPASLLAGASFLVVSDAAARVLGVPVGVVTALCGGPFFLLLLKREQRRAGG